MSVFKKKIETVEPAPVKPKTSLSPDPALPSSNNSIIGQTLFIKGNLSFDEEVLIEGKIEGIVNSTNRVIVGKQGIVNAEIDAHEVIIKGTVNGNVKGSFKVEIFPGGVLNGNIISQRVVLTDGAIFKGNIDMTYKGEKTPDSDTSKFKPVP